MEIVIVLCAVTLILGIFASYHDYKRQLIRGKKQWIARGELVGSIVLMVIFLGSIGGGALFCLSVK